MIEREIYAKLKREIATKEILVITGPRQVGKTVTVKWLIQDEPNKIYLDLTLASVRNLFEHEDYNNIVNRLSEMGLDFTKRAVIAIDEIQLLKNLPEIIKYLYDNEKYNIKFILTGSSAFYLKNHFTESLSVRKVLFELLPLTFSEFLKLRGVEYKITSPDWQKTPKFDTFRYETLKSYYNEYVEYGGFPAVVASESGERKRQMLDIIFSSYINMDVEQLADFQSTTDLRRLVSLLGARVGSGLNIDELSKILGLSRPTVSNYVSFLEQTYLIRLVSAYSASPDVRERIPKKVYFVDTGIANINADLSGGAKFENTICHQLGFYGKLSFHNVREGEIDFILQTADKEEVAIEVKETPTQKYLNTLESRAEKLNISTTRLIGRYDTADFGEYIWGGEIS